MFNKPIGYREKSFKEFWKSERLPLLLTLPLILALMFSGFFIISYFQKGLQNLIAGLFFLIFAISSYFLYYNLVYESYRLGHQVYKSINSQYIEILEDIRISVSNWNGTPSNLNTSWSKAVISKGFLNIPNYDIEKGDIILTDSSIILMGIPYRFTNLKYVAPIEISKNRKYYSKAENTAILKSWKIIDDKTLLVIDDPLYKKDIKLMIGKGDEKLKLWLTRV
jgi:hypothetical protein